MGYGNNCAGCDCTITTKKDPYPGGRIGRYEGALNLIIMHSYDPEWSKTDLGRLAKEALEDA